MDACRGAVLCTIFREGTRPYRHERSVSLDKRQERPHWFVVVALLVAPTYGCEFVTDDAVVKECVAACDDPICGGDRGADAYDCQILESARLANEPDPMVFKSQISLESNFSLYAVSPDSPCDGGREPGWTEPETKSFGLMQLTPACGWLPNARLADGHPNLAHEEDAALWPTSVFNPAINITEGVRAIMVDRANVRRDYPGCTDDDYTLMALGAFNQGENAVSGCGLPMMSLSAQNYVRIVLSRYMELAGRAHWPYPY